MRWKLLLVAAAVIAFPAAGLAVDVDPHRRDLSATEILGLDLNQVSVGAGLSNFTGEAANELGAGSAWDVRADLGVSDPVAVELGYAGGINSIVEPGLEEFNVYTNGLQAAVKVEPWTIQDRWTPYASVGLGLTRMSVAKDAQVSPSFQSDTAGNVPLAIGADVDLGSDFVLGARANWDVLFDNELLTGTDRTDSDRLGLTINIGTSAF